LFSNPAYECVQKFILLIRSKSDIRIVILGRLASGMNEQNDKEEKALFDHMPVKTKKVCLREGLTARRRLTNSLPG
jgi:hypothetical protein